MTGRLELERTDDLPRDEAQALLAPLYAQLPRPSPAAQLPPARRAVKAKPPDGGRHSAAARPVPSLDRPASPGGAGRRGGAGGMRSVPPDAPG